MAKNIYQMNIYISLSTSNINISFMSILELVFKIEFEKINIITRNYETFLYNMI